jgi:S1-C subfamily serine protease
MKPPRHPSIAGLLAAFTLLATDLPAAAQPQLPPAPTPVPGSLLDRSRPAPGAVTTPPVQATPAKPDGKGQRPAQRMAFGTAFRIGQAGHLVTNRHVVDRCTAIGIVANGKASGNLRVLALDPKHDLALLAGPPGPAGASLRAENEPAQGEDVLIYGYPLPGMLSASGQLGAGMVTALTGIRNDPDQLQIDAPVQSGNSGGPLLDRRGQVIGVVFAKLNALRVAQLTGDLPQNVNFAVRLAPLKRLLDAHGVSYAVGSADAPQLSNQQVAARAREWTVPIACQRPPG